MSRTYPFARWGLAMALLAVLIAAPETSAKHGPKTKGPLVDVVLTDDAIHMPAVLKEGWVTFRITNNGYYTHSLSAQGRKRIHALAVSLAPDQTVLVPIKLGEGTYSVWDPVEDNAARGLRATVVVKG